ncbi:hypothetical protein PRIPAC_83032 [Pristionchus pacificus]|uniref:G-patch domain-containing protein n=1 Tax=Pristionchus pacificus TaxID=54126 RepID=A0A2A6CBH7_PRIPA|nr:hypothetical protein PRIPAC_83032 [Pristionchus pacificus]|eukprot:PDM75489.1 hypothetical protein PRIPAC_42666 [Pristionchus pacificus]
MFSDYGASADSANGEGSIADMLRQAATEVLTAKVPPGFVFIEEYNMYYSHESGYYYDQNTSLFYHSETQTYYYYDETDGQYKVYQSMKPRPYWGPIDGPSSSIRTIIHTLQLNGRDELIDEQLLIYSDIGRLSSRLDLDRAMNQEDIDVCETLFGILETLEDEEDRNNRRGRRDQRERDRRYRRDEDDYRRNMERSSRRRQVFDGDNFVEVEDRRAQEEDWYREKERKSTKEREWDRGKERPDREERDRREKEEKKRIKEEIEERRRHRSRTWSSSDSEGEKEEKAKEEEDERVQMMKEEGYDQPPCVRFINMETLDLFIITMSGGLVGLAPECDVKVPDQTLPPRLAQLLFVQEKGPEPDKKMNDEDMSEFARIFSKRSTRSGSKERGDRRRSRSRSRDSGRRRSGSREKSSEDRGRGGGEERPGEKAEWRRIEKHVKKRQLPPNASRKERRAFERIWGKIDGDPIHGKYFLRVLSNAAKCTVDGVKVKKGEPDVPIANGCMVTFAKTNRFTLHIHSGDAGHKSSGRNTCAGCEPGLLLAEAAAAAPPPPPQKKRLKGEAARRAHLKQMKESLGIEEDEEKEPKMKYTDRAKERRKMFGSDPSLPKRRDDRPTGAGGMYDGCAAKPLPGAVPIVTATDAKAAAKKALSSENKASSDEFQQGFKLLKSMGWKEGEGLGRKNEGIVEPVANEFKGDRTGLGAAAVAPTKNAIWDLARSRFKEIEESEKKN